MAAELTGRPARSAMMRATFMPCSASGIAQPMITSSICLRSSMGTRPSAPFTAIAPKSSGRVFLSVPRGALPTGVRTALTITASFIRESPSCREASSLSQSFASVPQRLACFQREPDAFGGLFFTAQREKRRAFEIQQIVLGQQGSGGDIASRKNMRHMVCHLHIVVADELALAHEINAELERSQHALARRRD